MPWFLRPGADVDVGEPTTGAGAGIDRDRFPSLKRLVEAATVTPVRIDGVQFELLSWLAPPPEEVLSWLCPTPPSGAPDDGLYPDHRDLLSVFGGIVERSVHEPETWLLNCNDALTASEARHDASFLNDYLWILDDPESSWPIDLHSHYSICREANGNTTLCHRVTGDVLLFAPDHAFNHVEVLEGCPPYSLYRLHGVRSFADWVNTIADQWLAVLGAR